MTGKTPLRRLLLWLTAGAFLLDSGFGKLDADKETAEYRQGFAAGGHPTLGKMDPQLFARMLAAGEIAAGTALLTPSVPAAVAAAVLAAFSAGLIGLYLKTPDMRREGSRWLFGIGLSLTLDGLASGGDRR